MPIDLPMPMVIENNIEPIITADGKVAKSKNQFDDEKVAKNSLQVAIKTPKVEG